MLTKAQDKSKPMSDTEVSGHAHFKWTPFASHSGYLGIPLGVPSGSLGVRFGYLGVALEGPLGALWASLGHAVGSFEVPWASLECSFILLSSEISDWIIGKHLVLG